jgi:curved DNA-binding protein
MLKFGQKKPDGKSMGVEYKDYYSILGVPKNATQKEIKSAYRKKAREFHPDVNPGATEKFKDINEAHEALKDPEKRKMYDSLGSNWRQGQSYTPPPGYGGGGYQQADFGDMGGFSSFFDVLFGAGAQGGSGFSGQGFPGGGGFSGQGFPGGGFEGGASSGGRGRPGAQAEAPEQLNNEEDLYLDLEEVVRGVQKEVSTPSGKRLTVNIPKGVTPGAKIRLAGEGKQGRRGRGDLLLVVRYRKHPKFKVEEDNLVYEASIPIPDLVLGAEIHVPTLQGQGSMRIPPGTQPGRLMRLKGQGLPSKDGKSTGDLLVRPKALIPEHPSEREKALYQELRALSEG